MIIQHNITLNINIFSTRTYLAWSFQLRKGSRPLTSNWKDANRRKAENCANEKDSIIGDPSIVSERNALNILRIVCFTALTSDPNQSHHGLFPSGKWSKIAFSHAHPSEKHQPVSHYSASAIKCYCTKNS